MRIGLIVIGLLLLAGGIWIVAGHASVPQTDTLVQIGSAKLQSTHEKALPAWAGYAGIVVGLIVAAAGIFRRR
ncbi:hypothetical protein ACYJW8_01285 [Frateuria aurantia]